jgi:hypothetical protein
VAVAGFVLFSAGCGMQAREARPTRLLDGTAAPPLPEALDSVGGSAVVSRVRVLRVAELGARGRACIDAFRPEFQITPRTRVVARTGAIGASLTFLDARRRVVLGCDRTARPAASSPWCARSVGRLFAGRLHDARVDILCVDAHGRPIGFGWVEAGEGTRWIVVRDRSVAEVEEVAAGLPVRVMTIQVTLADSSARFPIAEYDQQGREVRRYRFNARVAG